jgi:chemotaxis signal transduction protein
MSKPMTKPVTRPMTTTKMVCFSAGGVNYAIRVEATLAVRTAAGMVTMPEQRPDVVGVLPGTPPLSVIAPHGTAADANHILVVTTPALDFGLLVDAVTEICAFDDCSIQSAPAGQDAGLIAGVAERAGTIVLIADPDAMAARM